MPKINKHFSGYLKNKNLSFLLLEAVTEKEIMNIISNISTRKAVGPNSIPNLILKEFKDKLKIPLTINTSNLKISKTIKNGKHYTCFLTRK